VLAGLDPKAISLVVSALSLMKVYRAIKSDDSLEGNYRFYEMLQIDIGNALINEIAWAPGCLHPFDVMAAACDDATARVFHVDCPNYFDDHSRAVAARPPQPSESLIAQSSTRRNAPSGIGAGLAGMSRTSASRHDMANKTAIKHVSREVATLPHDEGSPVWKVKWIYDGN